MSVLLYKFNCLFITGGVFLLSFIPFNSVTQTPIPKSSLTEEETVKFGQIAKLKQEAEDFHKSAKSLYRDIDSMPGDSDEEKQRMKALENHNKAFEKKKEANIIKYDIYEKHLKKLHQDSVSKDERLLEARLLEEEAEEKFYRSAILRDEAYDSDEKETRYKKLKHADEEERAGIENLEKALSLYYEYKEETGKSANEDFSFSREDDRIEVNEELLKNIKRTLNYIPQKDIVEEYRGLALRDSIQREKLLNLWYSYLYPPDLAKEPQNKSGEELTVHLNDTTEDTINAQEDDATGIQQKNDRKPEKKLQAYRVQIAADKKPLSQGTLRKLYDGQKDIERIMEGEWYKYSIGDFSSFEQAEAFKKSLNLEDAFIVVKKETKAEEPTGEKTVSSDTEKKKKEDKITDTAEDDIVFKVQLAASVNPLTGEELEEIYQGIKKIQMDRGDGWYRYSIGSCPTYFHAVRLKNKCGVKGAFVVAYQNKERLNAYQYRDYWEQCSQPEIRGSIPADNGVVFSLQIAASREKIGEDEISRIYCGDDLINEYREDIWFKYTVGSYTSYKEASAVKKTICVSGAFVVAFKNGEKIDVKQAINETSE